MLGLHGLGSRCPQKAIIRNHSYSLAEPMLTFLPIGPLETNLSGIWTKMCIFLKIKMPFKMLWVKFLPFCSGCIVLTHLPLDKMAAIWQTIFSDVFSWMKSFVFWLKSHWSLRVGGAVRFLVVSTIAKEERPPRGRLWMEQYLISLTYWPIYGSTQIWADPNYIWSLAILADSLLFFG